ncbi:HDIG domain-containing metalloprotein [Nocardioides sp. NPDC004968]|uniref:HDIG domain-containing metalloprotein n=1 Tax=Nocardioides sp. NPDC004968 TaxID=3155894 RepID=UPI0033A9A7F4
MATNLDAARAEAQRLVEPLGRRWMHLQAVGRCAEGVADALALDRLSFPAAAWLHDIGYAPELIDTGMHAIDGARYLARQGWDPLIVSMVAHHSCALLEAAERDLSDALNDFERPPADYEDAICFCDMTNGPAGDPVAASDRLDEIEVRYGPDHLVTRFIRKARPEILGSVSRVQDRLAGVPRPA